MKTSHSSPAKIVNHGSGMGAPDKETVRRRAMELAQIDGRLKFNEQDWVHAKRELHGGQSFDNDNDEDLMFETVSERDMIASDAGHHVENLPMEDADNIGEELISEGMDEAVHDQMLEASKVNEREEES